MLIPTLLATGEFNVKPADEKQESFFGLNILFYNKHITFNIHTIHYRWIGLEAEAY